jgi:hypothetical protein
MIAIRALDGTEVTIDPNAVTLVAGPYPHDLGPHTYVHGVERGVLVATEDAAALVARLRVDPPLAKLTRPDRSPVWVRKSAVDGIRPPMPTEQQRGGAVKAVILVGELHQAVREDVQTATRILTPSVTDV